MEKNAAERFLDALDQVLNSNSLLLMYTLPHPGMDALGALEAFLDSPGFGEAFFKAAEERKQLGWLDRDLEGHNPRYFLRQGRLIQPGYFLQLKHMDPLEGFEYLTEMLTCKHWEPFFSPYNGEWAQAPSETLVAQVLDVLTQGRSFEVARVEAPNFLFSMENADLGDLPYFSGGMASDSATILLLRDRLYLLLTNGTD